MHQVLFRATLIFKKAIKIVFKCLKQYVIHINEYYGKF